MKLDIGEVLDRAWKITWNHKVMWIPGAMVAGISFLPTPIMWFFQARIFLTMDQTMGYENAAPDFAKFFLLLIVMLLVMVISIPVSLTGLVMPVWGTIQLERGADRLTFAGMLKGTLKYFWRLLGVMALIWTAFFLLISVLYGCMFAVSMLTFGLGMVCMMPLMLLLIPVGMLIFSLYELAWSGILADELGVMESLRKAWELAKSNFGPIALTCIIIYLVSMVVGSIISVPMMILFLKFPFVMMDVTNSASPDAMFAMMQDLSNSMIFWSLALLPVYAVLYGVFIPFMQTLWTLTYLRLTGQEPQTPARPAEIA
ncbi:MAG: hypothetical protein JXA13_03070 [Anaerolineales bacterium]|nr:hypothetical protein [Anaerolineales bacterium]